MMNMNVPPFVDPRMDARMSHQRMAFLHAQMQQQQRQFGIHQPPQGRRDDQEVAGFLLQLKRPENDQNGGPPLTDAELRMQAQHQAALMRSGYPPVGAVYGYPTTGFDRTQMLASGEHQAHTPIMEEPVMTDVSIDALLGDSTLVLPKDRDLVPDALFVAMAQMKPCKLTPADRVGCYKNRTLNFVGMCCKHCGGQPGFGRFFPNSVRSLAQTTTSQTILKHIGGKCRFTPPAVRRVVIELQRQQAHKEGLATGRPRYGSRKIFFQRMWARLHDGESPDLYNDDLETTINEEEDETTSQVTNLEEEPAAGAVSAKEAPIASEGSKRTQDEVEREVATSPDFENDEGQEGATEPSNKRARLVPI